MSSLAADASPDGPGDAGMRAARRWQNLWVRLAVALAFADASIVVLALPQIVDRLHTSIAHSTWVIMAYNLALIATSLVVVAVGHRIASTAILVAGLIIFGLASIGCGTSGSLAELTVLRCVQGVGGGLVLAGSLPVFAGAVRPGDSALNGWSAAAAVGAAVGPAAGGILTELFDWRSIFLAQAPIAAAAAVAVLLIRRDADREITAQADRSASRLDPLTANIALLLLSAALIGALFLVVIQLINVWQLSPIEAAAVVSVIPVSTAAAERLVRGRSALVLGAVGALLVAAGLILLALTTHRQVGVVIVALVLCGAGLGLAYPGLTAVALQTGGSTVARAAKTVAARDLGLVIGLLVLTPVFVARLNVVINSQTPVHEAEAALISSPLPTTTKIVLGVRLLKALNGAGSTNLPDVTPAFAQTAATSSPAVRVQLAALQAQINAVVARAQRDLTRAFRRPFAYAAIFALLVLPLLAARVAVVRRRGIAPPPARAV